MAPNATLETLSLSNPLIVNEKMKDNNQDPDLNFFQESVSSFLDTDYVSPKDFKGKFKDYTENSFPVLHLNIKIFKVRLSPSKKLFICFNNSPSKMMNNAFYFILKALFVFKMFKFLSSLFGHVEKTA